MSPLKRPPIPAAIKREVRIRCGYGCVICGAQPYDYDHIEDYEVVKCHEADNLTLLCKHHHGEKTLKNLPREAVEQHNKKPFNCENDTTKSRYLYYSGKNIEVHIGGSVFKYHDLPNNFEFIPLKIDNTNIISFKTENDKLLMNFVSYDKNNNKTIEIIENEITHSTIVWDAEWEANKLTLREGNGRYILKLEFKTPNIIEIDKGYIHYANTDLIIDDNIIFIANNKGTIGQMTASNCKVGLSIDGMLPYKESWRDIKKYMRKAKKSLTKRSSGTNNP